MNMGLRLEELPSYTTMDHKVIMTNNMIKCLSSYKIIK